ncbi:hypothetical protein SH1V18_09960 [Vallitalea longa]|uniref:DUF2971 domain-containing protein n=1 Tax=Vallitalea longa TaxID=2936439 RepID=A0A9W6DDB2_9FIRM|nr:DUF2971 domain-containing protein [Vallitalea longa]GKX28516.1 hypothetical protein SH1V18_09960 [Vallitalea longa]
MDGNDINKKDIKSLFESAMKLYQLPEKDGANKLLRQIAEMSINTDSVDELYYKGMSHTYLGWETTKSIQCFKKILQIGTTNCNIIYNIGDILYKKNDTYNANKFFENILETETRDITILFETGKYLLKIQNSLRALDCFDKVLYLTENIIKLHTMASQLEKINENNIRYEYYNKILDLQDNNVEDKYCKGNAAYCLYRDSLAVKYFKEVAEIENQNILILLDTANKLCILKKFDVAYKCLQKIPNLSNLNMKNLCSVTKLFYILNKPNQTVKCIEKILVLQTNDLISLYDLAEFLSRNRILYATKLCTKILSIKKSKYSTTEKYMKVLCAINLNDPKTENYFNDVINDDIKDIYNFFLLNNIAHSFLSLNKHDYALICFEKITSFNDTNNNQNAEFLIKKAISLKVLGEKQNAIDYFNKILKLNLNVGEINLLYDAGLQLSGLDNKTAEKFFKKISQLYINNLNIDQLYFKGMSEYFLHKKDEAKKYIQKIDVQSLKDIKTLLDIGIVMFNLGSSNFAKNCFNKLIQSKPSSKLDYINIGTAYKYLMDFKNFEKKELENNFSKNYWEAVVDNKEFTFQFNIISPFLYDFFNKNNNDNKKKTNENTNKIYHYTGITALKGILDNEEFWVTKSDFLNDPSETSYISKVLENLDIKRYIKNKKDFINDFEKEVKEEKKDVYILSMSTDKDSLPMWKNYSNDDGYNIKVDKNKFKNSFVNPNTYILGKVIYIDNEENNKNNKQYKLIKHLITSIYKSGKTYQKENDNLTNPLIKKAVFSHIRLISLFVKHSGYEYEHEYRYVFIPQFWLNNKLCENNDRNNVQRTYNYNALVNYYCNFKTNGKGLIPYITVPIFNLANSDEPVIEEIRFSPTLDKDVAIPGLENYFKLKGLTNINVEPSSIPFRNI